MPLWLICLPIAFSLGVLVGALMAAKPEDAGDDVHTFDACYRRGRVDGMGEGFDAGFRAGTDYADVRRLERAWELFVMLTDAAIRALDLLPFRLRLEQLTPTSPVAVHYDLTVWDWQGVWVVASHRVTWLRWN